MSDQAAGPSLDLSGYAAADNRIDLWTQFITEQGVGEMVEVGVYRGHFAQAMLDGCPDLTRYYLVDPWRHLDDWNKPANKDDPTFEEFYSETLERTKAHADKRVVLRGKTTEVVDSIADGSLDFAYVDGDHSLRGITIDLIRLWPKVRPGGFLGGDDFSPTIWQHPDAFEPTLVFPWSVYFAEAVGAPVYAFPHRQFLIHKVEVAGPAFTDYTGRYPDITMRHAFKRRPRQQTAGGGRQPAGKTASSRPGVLRRLRRRLR